MDRRHVVFDTCYYMTIYASVSISSVISFLTHGSLALWRDIWGSYSLLSSFTWRLVCRGVVYSFTATKTKPSQRQIPWQPLYQWYWTQSMRSYSLSRQQILTNVRVAPALNVLWTSYFLLLPILWSSYFSPRINYIVLLSSNLYVGPSFHRSLQSLLETLLHSATSFRPRARYIILSCILCSLSPLCIALRPFTTLSKFKDIFPIPSYLSWMSPSRIIMIVLFMFLIIYYPTVLHQFSSLAPLLTCCYS